MLVNFFQTHFRDADGASVIRWLSSLASMRCDSVGEPDLATDRTLPQRRRRELAPGLERGLEFSLDDRVVGRLLCCLQMAAESLTGGR